MPCLISLVSLFFFHNIMGRTPNLWIGKFSHFKYDANSTPTKEIHTCMCQVDTTLCNKNQQRTWVSLLSLEGCTWKIIRSRKKKWMEDYLQWIEIWPSMTVGIVNHSTPFKLTTLAHIHPPYINRYIMLLQKNPYPPREVVI